MKEMNLTQGKIVSKLLLFSLPMIIGNLLQQVYNLVDTVIVGKYLGSNALAAVGSSYTLMTFITSIIIGLAMGSGALFSKDYGENNQKQLKQDVKLSFVFIFVVSLILAIVVYPATDFIMNVLQIPIELLDLTKEYVLIVFSGIMFVFLYNFFAYLLRGVGQSLIPLIFLAISSIINIVLDIYFVMSLNMGIKGAALATVIAQIIAGVTITLYSLLKLPIFKNKSEKITWDNKRLSEIIVNDVSTGIQQSVMNFGILMIQGLVNSFGSIVMASFASAVKIDSLAYMPAQEFGNAYSLFVSQNYGANQHKRIKEGTKYAFIISIIFCAVISIGVIVLAPTLMKCFIDASEILVINEGVKYLRIEGAMYIGIGILFLWYGYFRGVSKPHISLILTIISLGTRVLLSYAFAPTTSLGVIAIWLSIPIGWILADIIGLIFYKKVNR